MHVFASPFRLLALGIVLTLLTLPGIANAGTRLVMVTSDYCPFCQAWEREVGVVMINRLCAVASAHSGGNGERDAQGVSLQAPVVGTPTFPIIQDGREIDRSAAMMMPKYSGGGCPSMLK